MTNESLSAAPGAADPRRWQALGVLGLIQFMLILDVTVVNVALPKIQVDLGMSESSLAWVVEAYVLAAGGLLLLGGRLADLIGRRITFLAGVALFGVASATCGFAQSGLMMDISRFVQGMGEALAAPASLGIIAVLFHDPKERIKALGIFGGLAGLGGTSGTVISGFITHVDWRWIFFINVPVAIAALLLVPRLVDESKSPKAHRPDFLGAILGTSGLLAVVYGLLRAADHDWIETGVVTAIAGGLVLVALMVVVEARSSDPLIPLSFFQNRTRVTTNIVTLFFSTAFFSYFFLLTLVEQQILHWTSIKCGLSYLPFGICIGAGIGIGTGLMPKVGVKALLATGFALDAVGMGLATRIGSGDTYVGHILPGMILLALGSGLSFPAIGNASLHQVTSEDSSLASGVQQAIQQIGGALGLATLASIAVKYAKSHPILVGGHPVMGPDGHPLGNLADGATIAYWIGAVSLAIGGLLVVTLMEYVDPVPKMPGAELDAEPA
ncbi:MFS transporter [Nocardioides jejuensis]|nr:MFS transporter [Nocardioides jejuensis]